MDPIRTVGSTPFPYTFQYFTNYVLEGSHRPVAMEADRFAQSGAAAALNGPDGAYAEVINP